MYIRRACVFFLLFCAWLYSYWFGRFWKQGMEIEAAEKWIVDLIRGSKLDAKIDSRDNNVVMGGTFPSVYQQVYTAKRFFFSCTIWHRGNFCPSRIRVSASGTPLFSFLESPWHPLCVRFRPQSTHFREAVRTVVGFPRPSLKKQKQLLTFYW